MSADDHTPDKEARRAYQAAWRLANNEKRKAYAAAYYLANKERMNAEAAARYRANTDAYKQRARQWELENAERKRELRAVFRERNREKIKHWSAVDWRKHNAKRKAAKATYRAKYPELGAHHVRLRQTRKQQATPIWADLDTIKAVYKQAAQLRKQSGQKWHVDHVVPLKHPLVCGLHLAINLQVIPADTNRSKGNRLPDA